ncbi:hypothetical protein AB9P05_00030 [Roseivirga sp. BDSF3-8]|uniref:hypothetical protein n=1 Tax=Roseivirga sp. BDSF3-8 TaxID=3241598 RepID=UPI0035323DBB
MIYTGLTCGYHFLQTATDDVDFFRLVEQVPEVLVGKAVAVVSFDSGPLKPAAEEYRGGWTYDSNEVAYFPYLNEKELSENIFANGYDEWYLFDKLTKLKSSHAFCNYSAFGLTGGNADMAMRELQEKFWQQIMTNKPNSFILYGGNFIYGSMDDGDVKRVLEAFLGECGPAGRSGEKASPSGPMKGKPRP